MAISNDLIKLSETYQDLFSDLVLPGAMKIGDEEFFRLTFMRHKLTPTELPSGSGIQIPVEMTKEAQCTISIPMSVAVALAQAIETVRNTPQQELK